jgi:hypothetical protein
MAAPLTVPEKATWTVGEETAGREAGHRHRRRVKPKACRQWLRRRSGRRIGDVVVVGRRRAGAEQQDRDRYLNQADRTHLASHAVLHDGGYTSTGSGDSGVGEVVSRTRFNLGAADFLCCPAASTLDAAQHRRHLEWSEDITDGASR